jgi:hypothetical protein
MDDQFLGCLVKKIIADRRENRIWEWLPTRESRLEEFPVNRGDAGMGLDGFCPGQPGLFRRTQRWLPLNVPNSKLFQSCWKEIAHFGQHLRFPCNNGSTD